MVQGGSLQGTAYGLVQRCFGTMILQLDLACYPFPLMLQWSPLTLGLQLPK